MARHAGKHVQKPARGDRRRTLALCLALVLTMTVGGTLAFIVLRSDSVENTFQPASVTSAVVVGEGTRAVENTGDVPAFIRAAVTVNWVSMDSGSNTTRGLAPVKGTDYTLTLNTTEWIEHTDGYYYYKYAVAPGTSTSDLVTAIEQKADALTGYELAVEVAAEAIQANGDTDDYAVAAYRDAWGDGVPTLPGGGA